LLALEFAKQRKYLRWLIKLLINSLFIFTEAEAELVTRAIARLVASSLWWFARSILLLITAKVLQRYSPQSHADTCKLGVEQQPSLQLESAEIC
jgi:hypothetical protein